jgi:hypothetical protein
MASRSKAFAHKPGMSISGAGVLRSFWSISRSPFGVVLSYPLCVFSPRVILVSDTYVAIVFAVDCCPGRRTKAPSAAGTKRTSIMMSGSLALISSFGN